MAERVRQPMYITVDWRCHQLDDPDLGGIRAATRLVPTFARPGVVSNPTRSQAYIPVGAGSGGVTPEVHDAG